VGPRAAVLGVARKQEQQETALRLVAAAPPAPGQRLVKLVPVVKPGAPALPPDSVQALSIPNLLFPMPPGQPAKSALSAGTTFITPAVSLRLPMADAKHACMPRFAASKALLAPKAMNAEPCTNATPASARRFAN
jgi:hypothetical protein